MTTPFVAKRHWPLEGVHNLRDIGGYPTRDGHRTRWGQLFRSDSLHCLSPSGQALLIEQKLRTVIDLRHDTELRKAPNVFAASDAVTYVNVPLFAELTPHSGARASVNTLADLYKTALDTCGRPLAEVLTVLSNDGFPALIHCTAGKDRTGIVVALLLSLAGVDADTIAEDYALTGTHIQNLLVELRQEAVAAGRDPERFERMLEHTPAAMLTMLTHLEQYGGSEAYLKGVGLHENQIKSLRTALIE